MERRRFITIAAAATAAPALPLQAAPKAKDVPPNITLTHKLGEHGREEVHLDYDHLDWLNPATLRRLRLLFDFGQPFGMCFGETPGNIILSWFKGLPEAWRSYDLSGDTKWGYMSHCLGRGVNYILEGGDPAKLDMGAYEGWTNGARISYAPEDKGAIYAVYYDPMKICPSHGYDFTPQVVSP